MFVLASNHFRKCFSVNAGVWLRMENKFSENAFQLTVCFSWFDPNHFRTHAQREREIAPRPCHEPRAQSLSTSYPSTSPTNPEPRAIRLHTLRLRHLASTSNRTQIAPFDFAGKPKAQITPSTSPRSHPRISPITLITLRSHPKITLRQHRSH